jgi:hypothetical protein
MALRASKPAFNVREKLTELGRRFGLKGSELAAAETVQEARDLVSAGRRNVIINGNFDVWQRGTSSTGALSNAFSSADRWRFHTRSLTTRNISRQSFTTGQSDVPGNPKYYLRFETSNNSGSYGAYMMQRIEDVRVGSGEDVTVSFYAKVNSGGGTFDTAFSQQFGSGGSSAVDVSAGSFIPTSSWKKYSFTVSLPSISGKTIGTNNYLRFDIRFPSNTAATLDVSQVQVERGRNASDFEHRSYGEELALCQRYYWEVGSYVNNNWAPIALVIGYNATRAFGSIPTPVTMRAHPAVTFSQLNVYSSGSAIDVTNIFRYSQTNRDQEYNGLAFEVSTASGMSAGTVYRLHAKNVSGTSGYIRLNAEL